MPAEPVVAAADGAVLILGARAPVALDHARRFAAQGWRVVVGDSIPCRMTAWSHAVSACVALPSARLSPVRYARALKDAISAHRVTLVVPTCEEAFYLSHVRQQLPRDVRVAVADSDTMRTLHSKWLFPQLASDVGMQTPRGARVQSLDDAREWAGGAAVVLKPEFSRFGVHVRLYADGIPRAAAPLAPLGAWVVQDYCAGRELCSYSVADGGRLLAHVTYRPVHRLGVSSSYWFAPVESLPVRAAVESLVTRLGYTGQIAFDWIEDDTGTVRALECNPRAISGVHLFADHDDLPGALAGSAASCAGTSTTAARMIAAVMLAPGLAGALRRGQLHGWWRDWQAACDVIAVPGDRRPLAGAVADLAAYAAMALRQRCSLREAATRDTEWDGEPIPPP